jgi:hypothetical protein
MNKLKILTERKYNYGISRQTIYEWEDDIAKTLNLDFSCMDSYQKHPLARLARKMKIKKKIKWCPQKDALLFFSMNIDLLRILAWYEVNVLPIILDISVSEVDEFVFLTSDLPYCGVTSMQIYKIIKEKYPEENVVYIPQMASDRYFDSSIIKNIDFIQFGRKNPLLHEWAKKYCDENMGRSYIYRHTDSSKGMVKYINGEAIDIGIFETREIFMEYLKKSKISLCSTPLTEKTRDFGDNIDFLTARWFESVACHCHIFARYSDYVIPEVVQVGLDKVSNRIDSYHDFKMYADEALRTNYFNDEKMVEFMQKNSASERAIRISKDLKNYY